MEIIVEGHKIETKEITKIEEAGWRMHGFIIYLIGGNNIHITEKEVYDMTPNMCGEINNRYRKLRETVEAKWKEDKTEIPIFNL